MTWRDDVWSVLRHHQVEADTFGLVDDLMEIVQNAALQAARDHQSRSYERAVNDAQEALSRLLASSSLSFSDLQGMRLALIVIGQISPDTKETEAPTHRPQTV